MKPTEAIALARLTAAACPAQRFDQYTPDIWFDLLGDLGFEEARLALVAAAKKSPFVAPAEIRAEAMRARRERGRHYVIPAPVDPDDEPGYRRQITAARTAATAPPTGALAITTGPDEVTARRAAQFREHGYKPYLSGAGAAEGRGEHVTADLEAARAACRSASTRIHAQDPAEDLTEAERIARDLARQQKTRMRRGDPTGLTPGTLREVWSDLQTRTGPNGEPPEGAA